MRILSCLVAPPAFASKECNFDSGYVSGQNAGMIQKKKLSGWSRVAIAIDEVRDRLLRSTRILEQAGIPYAVLGGNAVAEWVGRVDKEAVRFTKDVDILLRREDLEAAKVAMEAGGFIYHETFKVPMFIDGPDGSARSAVNVLFANEIVREGDDSATPDIEPFDYSEDDFKVVSLESLVQMKLTSYRRRDQMHLIDMLDVGLIDGSWVGKYPSELGDRLQFLIDNPE